MVPFDFLLYMQIKRYDRDGKSTGTKDSIDYVRKLNKPVKIISF